MRVVFDLDGVICELKKPSESYADVIPKNDVIEKMREMKDQGDYLIIHTGRHMRTCNGNVSKVIEEIGKITEDWLQKWNVPYDELIFGKPYADVYIDDLGIEFSTKETLDEKIKSLQPYIIIPMAGHGKRFKDGGITEPKFMIKVKNKSTVKYFDLATFYSNGDYSNNPYINRGDEIEFFQEVKPNENLRFIGEDIPEGKEMLPAGLEIGPAQLAFLATFGFSEIPVHRKPIINIISRISTEFHIFCKWFGPETKYRFNSIYKM